MKEYDKMKDYYTIIIEKLIEIYERREAFTRPKEELRAIQVEPEKLFKEYADRYNAEDYQYINISILKLVEKKIITAKKNEAGKYTTLKLNLDYVDLAYQIINRVSVPEQCEQVRKVLEKYQNNSSKLVQDIINDFNERLRSYKKLPYDINFNKVKLDVILKTLCAIVLLQEETYIRNFSTAIFKDSKEFGKSMRTVIQNILYDYSDIVVERERILEVYNLFDNPTYVLMKGKALIKYNNSTINLLDMKGGIAIPNSALDDIVSIKIDSDRVVTVENLTTYHDSNDSNSMFIYLGGFHNSSKQKFLRLLYSQNYEKYYFHKGDIDVYGFLILENLIEKTEIPFKPLQMDIEMLRRYFSKGLYKELSVSDKKAMKAEKLEKYRDVLDFMLLNNCKVEQESIKALELLDNIKVEL